MRFRRVLVVNGHGADNQKDVLDRLCHEVNDASSGKGRRVKLGVPLVSPFHARWGDRTRMRRGDIHVGSQLARMCQSLETAQWREAA
jgi:hypothetical protein